MFDPELEAIVKCTELLAPLENDSKVRVLHYMANRFNLIDLIGSTRDTDSKKAPSSDSQKKIGSTPDIDANSSVENTSYEKYPALKDVVSFDHPKTEVDWVMIYAFYASEFGTKIFTREEVIEQYKHSRRWTQLKSKGLSSCFSSLVKRFLIKSINDTESQITSTGKAEAEKILKGDSTSKARLTTNKPNKKKDSSTVPKNTVTGSTEE